MMGPTSSSTGSTGSAANAYMHRSESGMALKVSYADSGLSPRVTVDGPASVSRISGIASACETRPATGGASAASISVMLNRAPGVRWTLAARARQ